MDLIAVISYLTSCTESLSPDHRFMTAGECHLKMRKSISSFQKDVLGYLQVLARCFHFFRLFMILRTIERSSPFFSYAF